MSDVQRKNTTVIELATSKSVPVELRKVIMGRNDSQLLVLEVYIHDREYTVVVD